jgi:hypothetical protein
MKYFIAVDFDEITGRFIARLLMGKASHLMEEQDVWEGETLPDFDEAMKHLVWAIRADMAKYFSQQQAGFVIVDVPVEELNGERIHNSCKKVEVMEVYTVPIGRAREQRAIVKCLLGEEA